MAKQGGKGKGKSKSKPKKRASKVSAQGDLTTIETHVEAYLGGDTSAATVLTEMGRDAAFTVLKLAQAAENGDLEQFARRLAAIPPQVETNMHELRRKSVRRLIETSRRQAVVATEAEALTVAGGALGIFDPQRVLEELATGGRPRRQAERLQVGDIACIGLPHAGEVGVRFDAGPPPEGQAVARLRLKVDSGMVFVGPPEASDGPRMGTVRLDPFSTLLDEHAPRGRFVRFANGVHALFAFLTEAGDVAVHFGPDDSTEALELSPMAPLTLPRAGERL
ncbi:MAG: hypothetical protein AAFV29_07270 [Myxococcota bacterium]